MAQENNVQGVGGQKDAFSVHQGVLDCSCGAAKLCISMCLRTGLITYKNPLLYMQYSSSATAVQYPDPGLHRHKDLLCAK